MIPLSSRLAQWLLARWSSRLPAVRPLAAPAVRAAAVAAVALAAALALAVPAAAQSPQLSLQATPSPFGPGATISLDASVARWTP